MKALDLVLLEQVIDSFNVAVHAFGLEGLHRLQIELRLDLDAHARHGMLRLLEKLGGVQQRLGGNATDIEAGAAISAPLLDDGDFHAELGRAPGADIAAWAGSNHNEVISVSHERSLQENYETFKGALNAQIWPKGSRTRP